MIYGITDEEMINYMCLLIAISKYPIKFTGTGKDKLISLYLDDSNKPIFVGTFNTNEQKVRSLRTMFEKIKTITSFDNFCNSVLK